MKIWLDDIRPMPEGFTHHIHNLAELKELLASTSELIEVMSFDHDLGPSRFNLEAYLFEDEPDGYEIIKWLAENYLNQYPVEVRVHSANPIGAENIRAYDRNVRKHLL